MRNCKSALRWAICAHCLLMCASTYAGNGASITLQPVPPRTNPPSSYPPGTTIVGQEITLGSVPARVWFEVHITGWAPDSLKVVQATISGTDGENDGGGYSGDNAECMGQSSAGSGDLQPAIQPCNTNADCHNALGGSYPVCPIVGSYCVSFDGINPPWMPEGKHCLYAFANECHPSWNPVILSLPPDPLGPSLNARFGFAMDPSESAIDFAPAYLGTLVLDVPASAKGTYTLDFDETQTFMQNEGPAGENNIPVTLYPARITVPCGRCCEGYEGNVVGCVDGVTEADCGDAKEGVFTEGEVCPESGGPACAECASNVDCDDGIACTMNRCDTSHVCEFVPAHGYCNDGMFCNGSETCNGAAGCEAGEPPCPDGLCDEVHDECRAGIPTVSNWGLVILVLALLVAAKLRYQAAIVGVKRC